MQHTHRNGRTIGRSARVVATALAIAALTVAALAASAAGVGTSAPQTATMVSTAENAKLGTILVAGNTVYTLKPSKTACDAKCLKAWPPAVLPQGVMSPTAGTGVDAAKLGTKPMTDGSLQITYAGQPLYFFFKDKSPGQVKGNITDKWGKWATVVTQSNGKSGSNGGGNKNAGSGGVSF